MATDSLDLIVGHGAAVSGLDLDALEVIIERGQQTFIEVGRALMEIRDRRLYRKTHATFEAYCGERWGWTRDYAYKTMRAADAVLTGSVDRGLQTERAVRAALSEKKARELADLAAQRNRAREESERRRLAEPIRRPKHETASEHDQVIELVRHQLTDIRQRYGIVTYWQPVWDAIDSLNQRSGK